MEFQWSDDQREFRAGLRRLLAARAPVSRARELAENGTRHDPALWRDLAQQVGTHGIAVPEAYGGSDGSWVELAIVGEEMGRVLLGGPFLSTVVLAGEALLASGDPAACEEHLTRIVAGELTAALAVAEAAAGWDAAALQTTAAGSRLTGTKEVVLDGAEADLLIVAAQGEDGPSLYLVDGAADGVVRTPLEVLDPTRQVARVELRDAPATLLGAAGSAAAVLEHVLRVASIFVAAEQAGGSAVCVEMTADYARTRRQFGRVIGAFQGVKHRLADAAVRTELCRSTAYWAAWQVPGSDESYLGAAVARAHNNDAYVQTAKDAIQLHGGIGFTWEHDAHLFLRRARADASLLGSSRDHRARLLPLVAGTGTVPATPRPAGVLA